MRAPFYFCPPDDKLLDDRLRPRGGFQTMPHFRMHARRLLARLADDSSLPRPGNMLYGTNDMWWTVICDALWSVMIHCATAVCAREGESRVCGTIIRGFLLTRWIQHIYGIFCGFSCKNYRLLFITIMLGDNSCDILPQYHRGICCFALEILSFVVLLVAPSLLRTSHDCCCPLSLSSSSLDRCYLHSL